MKNQRFRVAFVVSASISGAAISRAAVTQGSILFNGGGVNNALTGVASQTDVAFGGTPNLAIDGNTNGDYAGGSVTHTDDAIAGTKQWQVDLGSVKPVDQIVLWNRTGCCPLRLSNFRLGVYDGANAEVWAQNYYVGAGAVAVSEVVNPTAGTAGRYVRVQQLGLNNDGNNVLSLAEVQVFDLQPALFPNVAVGKPATQSSTAYGGDASRAVDGNPSGNFGDNTVTHTADSSNGWVAGTPVFWEVDLQGDFSINEIAINGRGDCCTERLGNFRVSILNDGLEVWGMDNFVGAPNSNLAAPGLWSTYEDTGGFFATGDKVRVSLIDGRNNSNDPNNAGTLSLAEVRVFGVPEPSVAGLAALGAASLLMRRRRRQANPIPRL